MPCGGFLKFAQALGPFPLFKASRPEFEGNSKRHTNHVGPIRGPAHFRVAVAFPQAVHHLSQLSEFLGWRQVPRVETCLVKNELHGASYLEDSFWDELLVCRLCPWKGGPTNDPPYILPKGPTSCFAWILVGLSSLAPKPEP